VPAKKAVLAAPVCQPRTQSQPANQLALQLSNNSNSVDGPTMKLKNFWYFLGANSETQWYCPPEVGALHTVISIHVRLEGNCRPKTHMEAISAIDVFTAIKPAHATRNVQIMPAVPPLISPMIDVLLVISIHTILDFTRVY
jgi:hypothetical protein